MLKSTGILLAVSFVALLQAGCKDNTQPSESIEQAMQDTALEHAVKHQDPKYVCPMHPEIVRDEPGSCPICGMDLVAATVETNPPADDVPSETMEMSMQDTALEHAVKHQDPKYVCPMHPEIVRDEPGSCPICGMDLVEKAPEPPQTTEKKILYWVAPMDPNYRRDEPGKSPMGMDLVPVYEEENKARGKMDDYPAISIKPGVVQNLGIRTTKVSREILRQKTRAVGRIDYDETHLSHVHLRADGWFEKLYVNAEGDPIIRGQVIGDYYSPEILSAQVDFLVALSTDQQKRLDQARNGLRLLGVPEETIAKIEKERAPQNTIPILSPANGIIARLGVREGMFATPATEAVTIATLDNIWVTIDVFEHQVSRLKIGAQAKIRVPAWPQRTWNGTVSYIYPELDQMSRTLRARVNIDNPDGALRPNMFAEVTILSHGNHEALTIPREALISTGERDAVIRLVADNRFQPVDVKPGLNTGDRIEILEGLSENDQVVTSGQFLIDSESSLQASFQRLLAE